MPQKRKRSNGSALAHPEHVKEKPELSSGFDPVMPAGALDMPSGIPAALEDREKDAPKRSDTELIRIAANVGKIHTTFKNYFQDYKPYIRVLRGRYAHTTKKICVDGKKLTWTEFCEQFFGITVRWMERLLAGDEKKKNNQKKKPANLSESQAQTALKGLVNLLIADSVEPPATRYERAVSMAQSVFDSGTIEFNADIQVGGLAFAELLQKTQALIENFEQEAKNAPTGYELTDGVETQIHATRQRLAEHLDKLSTQESQVKSSLKLVQHAMAKARAMDNRLRILMEETLPKAVA